MSEAPLFQNTDEQEAAFAPHQLPSDDPAARQPTDQVGDAGADAGTEGLMVPMLNPTGLGGGASAGTMGAAQAAAPVVPGSAAADDVDSSDQAR